MGINKFKENIQRRKLDHIAICSKEFVESKVSPGFEDVSFIHKALPEVNMQEIDFKTKFFSHELKAPIIIESMTGGTRKALKINSLLANLTERFGLAMGVGSQRAAIENPKLVHTYRIVREVAPESFIIANIGCSQILNKNGVELAKAACEMIDANALMIHLNPLQESIQKEGETDFEGVLGRISDVTHSIDLPIIVKETGAGISCEVAKVLESSGVSGIDVAGLGGTSWAAVEYYRAKKVRDRVRECLGKTFWDWGIPTVISLIEVANSVKIPVIASGGIRNGVHVAKSIALGAEVAGIALPLLKLVDLGKEELENKILTIIEELRLSMFLVGASDLDELKEAPLILTGKVREWILQRGFDLEAFAKKKTQRMSVE
ncbi:MAG: type 2 isopentenyl-diphosphate Delta-isomerase [Candidatus Bathyarchaeia archaeon]